MVVRTSVLQGIWIGLRPTFCNFAVAETSVPITNLVLLISTRSTLIFLGTLSSFKSYAISEAYSHRRASIWMLGPFFSPSQRRISNGWA